VQIVVLWDAKRYHVLDIYRRVGETICNFYQTTDNRITQGSNTLYFSVLWSNKIPLD